MPRYGFLLMRFRGPPDDLHGFRQGISPCSSSSIILLVTISYTLLMFFSFLRWSSCTGQCAEKKKSSTTIVLKSFLDFGELLYSS